MTFSKNLWHNFDKFIDKLSKEDNINLHLEFEINKGPLIEIYINNNLLFSNILTEDNKIIDINYHDDNEDVTIKIMMGNKTVHDTVIDNNGNIIDDKFAKIIDFKLNNFDLVTDIPFFYEYLKLSDSNGHEKKFVPGFWHNDILELTYTKPFGLWYNSRSTNNQPYYDFAEENIKKSWETLVKNVNKLDH